MPIDQKILAARLREARLAANLTQEQAADAAGLPRTAIVQIEAGNRAVSTLELAKLAVLFGRSIASFFEEPIDDKEDDVFVALLRATSSINDQSKWQDEISRCLAICRAGVELEQLLDRPPHMGPPSYEMPAPQRILEAVEQGSFAAEQQRLRLGLGHNPIADLSDLINSQNIWASGAKLPDGMSGLFLKHSSTGLCVLVNFDHGRARKRFSYAHEYAHAILDRQNTATVSLEQNRSDLQEVRANAFAAAFLLPRTGVWAFLNGRSKAGPSLIDQAVYDPLAEAGSKELRAQRRAAPRSQVLTYEDVAALAQRFGVSYQAALFRLKGLSIINESDFIGLREKEHFGKTYIEMLEVQQELCGHDAWKPDREIMSQVVHLALEAFRREEIFQAKLRELSSLLGIPGKKLLALAEAA